MRIQHTLALFSLTLLLWPLSVAAAEEATSSATFTLSVAMDIDSPQEAEDSATSQSMVVMALEGEALYQADMLRVDAQDQASQEKTTVLVDYVEGVLHMLYPDTLNGTRHNLAGFDRLKGFYALRDVMQGATPEMPGDWEAVCDRALLDGKRCQRHVATYNDDKVEWWVGEGNVPLKAVVTYTPLTITVDITSFARGASLDESLFKLPLGYTIVEAEGVPEGLPSL
jgi:hypothetical protein